MSAIPITDTIPLVRKSIYEALNPLTASGIYWLQAPNAAALPFVVYQAQDNGGKADMRVGNAGWSGLILIKALATTQAAAETLLATVVPGMNSLAIPSGYSGYAINATHENPVVIPPADEVWTAAHLYRITLSRTT